MRISGWSSDVCSSDLVDIEQHALRALEQDALAPRPRIIQRQPDGPRELKHELGDLAQVRLQPCAIDGTLAEAGAEGIGMRAEPVDLRAEPATMGQIADPDRAGADLAYVGRAADHTGGGRFARVRPP